jgi:uncharacterized membrane protein YkgB
MIKNKSVYLVGVALIASLVSTSFFYKNRTLGAYTGNNPKCDMYANCASYTYPAGMYISAVAFIILVMVLVGLVMKHKRS